MGTVTWSAAQATSTGQNIISDTDKKKMASSDRVQVYTTNTPCGAVTQEYKGLVMASKVKSRNAFSDIGSGLKSLVGGEIKGLSKLTRDVREELINELKETAAEMGANAIVGLRMETNSVFDGVLDMVVTGTAVYFT